MSRGGRREGKPGALYPNRTDMAQGPRKLPISVAPGQTYGEAGAQADAQRQVPMGNGPLNGPAIPAPMSHADVMSAAQGFNPPPVVPLGMPSLRPDEHVMTGIPAPAAPQPMSPVMRGLALLNSLGDSAPPEVQALRRVVAAGQANAATP